MPLAIDQRFATPVTRIVLPSRRLTRNRWPSRAPLPFRRGDRDALKKPARQSPPVFSAGSSLLRQSQCYGIAPSSLLDPTKNPRRLGGTGPLQSIPRPKLSLIHISEPTRQAEISYA